MKESPQKENGYTTIAHEILEAVAQTPLSDYESRFIHILWRMTYGFGKKTDRISPSQMCTKTGMKKYHEWRTRKRLIQRAIVIQTDNGIGFNKYYSQWKDKKRVTYLGIRVTPIGNQRNSQKLPKQVTKVTQIGNQKLPKQEDTIDTTRETYNIAQSAKKNFSLSGLLTWGEQKLGKKFVHPSKQSKFVKQMFHAGRTEQEIKDKWEELEEDTYWKERGIDFSIVANQMDKKKMASKKNSLIYDE